mgnify:CR=1 FL=1
MGLVTSSASTNNHNLYFSKDELAKILNLYSKGVSNGEWKDYAIDFNKNNANKLSEYRLLKKAKLNRLSKLFR